MGENVEQNVVAENLNGVVDAGPKKDQLIITDASTTTPVPASRLTTLKSFLDRSATRALNYARKFWSKFWYSKLTKELRSIRWGAVAILALVIVFSTNITYILSSIPNWHSKEISWKEMVDT